MFIFVPKILNLLSLIPYAFYDLKGEKLEKIRSDLKIRREQGIEELPDGGASNE